MIPLVDMHVHLLAGMDDGPRTEEDALDMCRIAFEEGVGMAAALAHQNEQWSEVTPAGIRQAVQKLAQALRQADLPLTVFPCAEVTVHPDIETSWRNGNLLSVADHRQYLLVELPHRVFLDLRETVKSLRREGVRVILAHPERSEEFLQEPGMIEELIHLGCLVQVSADSVTDPPNRRDEQALKSWFKRGMVHLLGSDGHSPRRRQPRMAAAYHQIVRWAGDAVADRVCSTNGMALLQGLPVRMTEPRPERSRWIPRFW